MSFDLIRQSSTTMGLGPYVLAASAGFRTFASQYGTGVPIDVGLQGLDATGAPVAQRAVGVGQLLIDGRLQLDTTTSSSNGNAPVVFACDSIVIVDVMSVAAVRGEALAVANTAIATHAALTQVHGISAFGATLVDDANAGAARTTLGLGGSATLNVGTAASTVAAGNDSRIVGAEQVANKDAVNGYAGRDGDRGILLPAVAAPTSPATGNVKLFGRDLAKRIFPAMVGPNGIDTSLQPLLARNKVGMWSAVGNTVTTPVIAMGMALPTTLGTPTARNVAATSLLESTRRVGYVSLTAALSVCGFRSAVAQNFRGQSSPTRGGFFQVTRFAVSDAVLASGARTYVGMRNIATAPADVEPSTYVNIIGIGNDAADTNWQVLHNDASGTATKIDTGIAITITSLVDLTIFSPPLSSSCFVRIEDLSTGASFEAEVTTNLPAGNTLLSTMNAFRGNGASGTLAVALDLISHYVETDY